MVPNFLKKIINSTKFKAGTLNYFYYYFKLCGIAPLKIRFTRTYDTKEWKWTIDYSKIRTLYNVFLMCLMIAMHVMSYGDAVESGFGGRFDKDVSVVAIFDSLIVFTGVLIQGIYCVKQGKIITIAHEISTIEKNFKNLTEDVQISTINNHVIWLSFGNVFMFFNPINTLIEHPETYNIIYSFSFRFCLYTINSLLIQYSIMIRMIRNFFKIINQNLLEVPFRSVKLRGIRSINNSSLSVKLDNSMHLYQMISNLSREISIFYSLPMLWSLLAMFVDVLMCLYHLIKGMCISNSILHELNLHDISHVTFLLTLLTVFNISVTDAIEEV